MDPDLGDFILRNVWNIIQNIGCSSCVHLFISPLYITRHYHYYATLPRHDQVSRTEGMRRRRPTNTNSLAFCPSIILRAHRRKKDRAVVLCTGLKRRLQFVQGETLIASSASQCLFSWKGNVSFQGLINVFERTRQSSHGISIISAIILCYIQGIWVK